MGLDGLELIRTTLWNLKKLGKIRTLPLGHISSFQFFRDKYRNLEISCFSNRGGKFIEISKYHGGSKRGGVRVPEVRQGVGWVLFEVEL